MREAAARLEAGGPDCDAGAGDHPHEVDDVFAALRDAEERAAARSGPALTLLDSAAFDAADHAADYLIRDVLAANQPGMIGAPFKSCKTLLSADLAISGGLAEPFLGRFEVPAPFVTVFVSGESGGATLQKNARSVAAAKGAKLADLGGRVLWGLEPADLTDARVLTDLRRRMDRAGAGLLIADPFYLCVPLGEGDGSQVGRMGAKLAPVSRLVADTGAAVLFNAHTRKRNAKLYEPPELGDLAGAGVAEWARQWLLIGRRSAYDPDSPGEHELSLTVGGSAGHSGRWAVDLAEYGPGGPESGRRWSVEVVPWADVREAEKDAAAAKREAADLARERATANRAERHADGLAALMRDGTADTKNGLRDRAKLSGTMFGPAWTTLMDRDVLARVKVKKGNRWIDGFALRSRLHGPYPIDHPAAAAFAVTAPATRDDPGQSRDLFETVPGGEGVGSRDGTAAPRRGAVPCPDSLPPEDGAESPGDADGAASPVGPTDGGEP